MKTGRTVAVVGMLGFAMVAGAAPMAKTKALMEGSKGEPDTELVRYGITSAADRALLKRDWEESTLINVAVRNQAFLLLGTAMQQDPLSPEGIAAVKAAFLSGEIPAAVGEGVAMLLAPADRAALVSVMEPLFVKRYPERPVHGKMYVKYTFLQGVPVYSAGMSLEDLLGVLMAPEPLSIPESDLLKSLIKGKAIDLARLSLRAEGKSFVMKNGVNPMTAKVEPVVNALNAAGCAGIEDVLRGLGAVDIGEHDREALKKVADEWKAKMLRGDLTGGNAGAVLGRLVVALGVDGYNRFVSEYNDGTGSVQ